MGCCSCSTLMLLADSTSTFGGSTTSFFTGLILSFRMGCCFCSTPMLLDFSFMFKINFSRLVSFNGSCLGWGLGLGSEVQSSTFKFKFFRLTLHGLILASIHSRCCFSSMFPLDFICFLSGFLITNLGILGSSVTFFLVTNWPKIFFWWIFWPFEFIPFFLVTNCPRIFLWWIFWPFDGVPVFLVTNCPRICGFASGNRGFFILIPVLGFGGKMGIFSFSIGLGGKTGIFNFSTGLGGKIGIFGRSITGLGGKMGILGFSLSTSSLLFE